MTSYKIAKAVIYGLVSIDFILLLGWMACYVNPFVAAAVTYIFSATIFGLVFIDED